MQKSTKLTFLFLFSFIFFISSCTSETENESFEVLISGNWVLSSVSYSGSSTYMVGAGTETMQVNGTLSSTDFEMFFDGSNASYTTTGGYIVNMEQDFLGQTSNYQLIDTDILGEGMGSWSIVGNTLFIERENTSPKTIDATIVSLDSDVLEFTINEFGVTIGGLPLVSTEGLTGTYTFEKTP